MPWVQSQYGAEGNLGLLILPLAPTECRAYKCVPPSLVSELKREKIRTTWFLPPGGKEWGSWRSLAGEMWAQPPPSLLYSGSAGDGSPAAAARAWLRRWFVASLELGTPWSHATNIRTKTQVCPFFWNHDMMSSTKHMVQNYVTELF